MVFVKAVLFPLCFMSLFLAVNIRYNPRISGLALPGGSPLSPISQYADDTSLNLSSDDSSESCFGDL